MSPGLNKQSSNLAPSHCRIRPRLINENDPFDSHSQKGKEKEEKEKGQGK